MIAWCRWASIAAVATIIAGSAACAGESAGAASFDPNHPTASGLVLTFDDEFNAVSWSAGGVDDRMQWADHGINADPADNPRLLSVHDGLLDSAAADRGRGWQYSGLQSVNARLRGFTQTYGYFEASIKTAAGNGAWNAWWLLNTDHFRRGAPADEIDIMENWGSTPRAWGATLHDGAGHERSTFPDTGLDLSRGFHRYGMLWDPHSSEIDWYFDGRKVGATAKFPGLDRAAMMLVLGLGIGSGKGQDASTPNPMHLYADYVRVYQFRGLHPRRVRPEPVSPAAGNTDPVAHVDALGNAHHIVRGDRDQRRDAEHAG